MEIEFCISGGHMRINPETFFRDAGRRQIHRMFVCLGNAWPNEGQIQEIQGWLTEAIRKADDAAAAHTEMYALWTAGAGRMAAISTDAATVRGCKRRAVMAKKDAVSAGRIAERYRGLLADLEKTIKTK